MTNLIQIKINNLPEKDKIVQYPYMIISYVDGAFWYYGADYDKEHCNAIANNLGKIVIDNPFYQSDFDAYRGIYHKFSFEFFTQMIKKLFSTDNVLIAVNANEDIGVCLIDGKRLSCEDVLKALNTAFHFNAEMIFVKNSFVYIV